MFCINCFHRTTQVTNSRPHKKRAQVWRRRQCQKCHHTFTTLERPALDYNQKIDLPDHTRGTFHLGKLIISISKAFSHSNKSAVYDSLWLAQSVEEFLSTQHSASITPQDIAAATHQILKQYDEVAALQYALQHQLLTSTRRRRGRPSLS